VIYTRRAVEGDVADLVALSAAFHAESPVHSRLGFVPEKMGALIMDAIVNPDWLLLVACDDAGAIVGTILLYCLPAFFSYDLEVGDIGFYVLPEHRGGRAALLLMKEAMDWSEMKGAARVQLGVTTGINDDQAARFFGRFGLQRSGLLMQRTKQPSA
jgi:GNAT superfamily N-acetyltransferase